VPAQWLSELAAFNPVKELKLRHEAKLRAQSAEKEVSLICCAH